MKFVFQLHIRLIAIFLFVYGVSACTAVTPRAQMDDPEYSPVPAQSLKPPPVTDGSLFQHNYAISLYNDQRARRIGDVITITLQERTNATKSASTSTSKDSDFNMNPINLFGEDTPGFLTAELEAERAFNGTGDSDQSNSLTGQITVTISDILPNGILEVRGEKWLSLNEGDEFIRVRGLVRPQDIGPDNTVMSHKLADARISYGGTGPLADSNRQGWISEMVNSPWWPF